MVGEMFGSFVHISIATGQGDVKVADPSVPWVCEESDLPAAQRPGPLRNLASEQIADGACLSCSNVCWHGSLLGRRIP